MAQGKSKKFNFCKRYDCLYHAAPKSHNACDYILCTGYQRSCPAGKLCNKYVKATPSEQSAIADKTWRIGDWNYTADGEPYLEVFVRWRPLS